MAKYKLLLDESGTFDSLIERYIIIGGLLFCEDDEKDLEQIFIPLHKHLCNVLGIEELHGADNKDLYNELVRLKSEMGNIKRLYLEHMIKKVLNIIRQLNI